MKSKSLWCPECKKKGLNPYGKNRARPVLVDDIDFLWCLYCDYMITSTVRRKKDEK
ncbi:hypothetical protein LCGC14_0534790 [marine sediment metagenome]|uniref:Uncharacterized protein n=1 Tax=marine sediment metagenome TaxID=412755 RepID=A0A0F9V2R3_9ZZZZ